MSRAELRVVVLGGRAGRSPAHRLRSPNFWLGALSVAIALATWQILVEAGVLSDTAVPTFTATLAALFDAVGTTVFWTAMWNTIQGWALGLLLGAVLAIPLGIVLGAFPLAYRGLRPVVEFLRPMPSVALIPLVILTLGIGLESKVFLVAFTAFFPVLIQTLYGVHDVDPVATDTARSFGFGPLQRLTRVMLPSSLPFIATGLRVAAAVALIVAVSAELVIGSPGLGQEINIARSSGALDLMYALVVVTGLLGLVVNALASAVEGRALRWHESHREMLRR